jgi:hypothetical protein
VTPLSTQHGKRLLVGQGESAVFGPHLNGALDNYADTLAERIDRCGFP